MRKKYFTNTLRAKKSLGQNFLINPGVLSKITKAAEIKASDIVLEIGPGKGILTKLLVEKAGRVVAIEKDHRLIKELRSNVPNHNIEIVEGDVLELNPADINLRPGNYKVVANIPYYITSNLLRKMFEEWPTPKLIVLMVQKEVAKRIVAKPPDMNILALSVQFYSQPTIISYVSKGSFHPQPKVDSAIIKLEPKSVLPNPEKNKKMFKIIKTAFAGKRKQLKNTLGQEILANTGIKPESRPEELSLKDWLKISSGI